MQSCSFAGIPNITINRLHPSQVFRRSFRQTLSVAENIFEDLDRQYANEIGFPRTYRSNLYPFASYLADLQYLASVARAIRQAYPIVRFLIAGSGRLLVQSAEMPIGCDILQNQLFVKGDARAYNLQRLVKLLDSPPIVQVPEADRRRIQGCTSLHFPNRHSYLLRPTNWGLLVEKLRRRLKQIKQTRTGRNIIWCIQDGYDVEALKKYLPDFTFIDPLANLAKNKAQLPAKMVSPIYQAAIARLTELFPEWTTEIVEMMEKYHIGVACRLPVVTEWLNRLINADRPQCALYSIGAITPVETVCAWVLNQNKIPVFSFQHGGSNFYFNTPLTRYVEFNPGIDQTTFSVSRLEAEFRHKSDPGCQVVEAGAINLYEWHTTRYRQDRENRNGRVLLIQGRYPSEAWKNLFCTEGEDLIFQKHEQLFDSAARHGLGVDIKLYPDSIQRYAPYFQRFLRRFGIKQSRIFNGIPAERIASDYELIIMEYIGSALNAFLMLLDRPVIYYLAEPELINPVVAEAFHQRHYVARDGKDLDRLFNDFRCGVLRSKYDPRFVDQFVYPLDGVDPGKCIAEHIRRSL
jgi:hypothetical protein